MMYRFWLVAGCTLFAALPACADDVQTLADAIDRHVSAHWAGRVEPAPPADDAEFLRRVCLDITGKIPTVAEARAFLDDPAPDKRRRLVDRLLDRPAYATHFTNLWRALLLPETSANFQLRFLVPSFEIWMRKQFADNVAYDRLVRGVLVAPLGSSGRMQPGAAMYAGDDEANPTAFYLAKEGKPENLAGSTARIFLGLRIECAQCHDHPNASWKRDQFWSYAAFFAGVQQRGTGLRELRSQSELTIPGKEQAVQATFLDGKQPQFKEDEKKWFRASLADWITSGDNPYFARAAVNRMWAYLFGIGLVDPVDDFTADNAPSHPELLDELAKSFVAHQFDLKFLIRSLTASRTYQLSSTATHPSQADARLFARMAVKGLTPEQLFDSVARATGFPDATPVVQRAVTDGTVRSEFLTKFAAQERPAEAQTSILQALFLMNGRFVADVTSPQRGELLAAVAEAPFLSTAGRVETLYLATLSRRPRAEESERLVKYVESGGAKKDAKAALGDVLWALLNSSEFILNH